MAAVDNRDSSRASFRIFTPTEANALLGTLEGILSRMDPTLARIRELRELAGDLEAYWGDGLPFAPDNERVAYARLVEELEDARERLDEHLSEIRALGAEPKDLQSGLVDFYGRVEGQLAFLCWQRGEPRVAHWHSLEGGFAGRKPLETRPKAEP